MYEDLDDNALVSRYRDGDNEAGGVLWLRYEQHMRNLIRSRFSTRISHPSWDSGEAIASGMLSFLSAIKKDAFESDDSSISGLIRKIVIRKCLQQLRKKRPHRKDIEDVNTATEFATNINPQDLPLEEIELEIQDLFDAIKGKLTELECKIITVLVSSTERLSDKAVAEKCECSVYAVRQAKKHFERELRKHLDSME